MNPWRVTYVLGWIQVFLAGGMLLPLLISLLYLDGDTSGLLLATLVTAAAGGLAAFKTRSNGSGELTIREGFAVVTLGWLLISFFGSLPFLFSGQIPSMIDAWFESMSGFTTTGASILVSPQDLPHGVAFWRCFMQWIGGLGIVLFGLAILPMLGVGGMHLFKAETPGPSSEKITPRLKDTAKILWIIYLVLTATEALLLWISGMTFYDAWAHSFTTMATGGFSTYNASIGQFSSPVIHLIVTLFMFLAGINFALYFKVAQGGGLKAIWNDTEWRYYAGIASAAALVFWIALMLKDGAFSAMRLVDSMFQTASILTTTGFATDDFNVWPPVARVGLLLLMIVGGMAGSTGGGMKVVRLKILVSHARQSLRRMIQPHGVLLVRMGGRGVTPELVSNITGFLVLFAVLWLGGTLFLALLGHDLEVALSGTLACLSNIGPGLGEVGPAGNFAGIHPLGKLMLSILMLLGRLEIYTVLVMLSLHFWKK
jgi:trk system potassium uptake protein TrkH